MDYPKYFYPKNSLNLYGLDKDFNLLSSLYSIKKLPKVLMISGIKGIGKSTLVNHFLFSIFDEKNYDKLSFNLLSSSNLHKQFINNIFQNIIYIKGSDFKSVKVEDIRNLKSHIYKSSINNKERFIILDDVELFNINSLNALLKIIEEPSKKNFFILINNKTKLLIDTIKSRTIEFNIILSEKNRVEIINKLIKLHNIDVSLDPNTSLLSPGNFLKFDYICNKFDISPANNFLDNLQILLNLYKKNKDFLFIDFAFYLTNFYFRNLKINKTKKIDEIYEIQSFVLDNLNKYLTYNLNQNSLINAINNKINNG